MQESLLNAIRSGSESDVREILWNHRHLIRSHISNLVTKVDDLLVDPLSGKKNNQDGEEGPKGGQHELFEDKFFDDNISASPYFSFRKRFENVRHDALFTVTRFFEPIHFAALIGHEETMRVLLEDHEEDLLLLNELEASRNRLLGLQENGRVATDKLTEGDNDEMQQQQRIVSAIETACSHITGYISHVKANLLDVNAGNKGQRHTALHIAANRGDMRIVRLLVEGLQSSRATKREERYTKDNAEEVGAEISAVAGARAKTNCVNVSNLTPAWFAASRGHKKVFEYLVRHGGFAPSVETEDQSFGNIWADNPRRIISSGAAEKKQDRTTLNAEEKKGMPQPSIVGSEEIKTVDPSSLFACAIASAVATASDVANKKEMASTKSKSDAAAAGFLFSSLSSALCIAGEMGYKGIVSYIVSTILCAPHPTTNSNEATEDETRNFRHSPLIACSTTSVDGPCIRCRSTMLGDALLFAATARRLEVMKVLVRGLETLASASPPASSQPQCVLCSSSSTIQQNNNTVEAYDLGEQRIAELSLALTAACRGDARSNNNTQSISSRPDPRFGAGLEFYLLPNANKKKLKQKLGQCNSDDSNGFTREKEEEDDDESEVEEEEEEEVPCDPSKLTDVVSFLLERGARSDTCLFSEAGAREVRLPAFLIEKKHTQAGASAEGAIIGANGKPPRLSANATIKPKPARPSPRPLPPLMPTDRDRRPPLHFLVCDGSLEEVRLLLHGSANPRVGDRGKDVSLGSTLTDAWGETALFFLPEFCQSWVARSEGRGSIGSALRELITLLTSYGADPNFVSSTTSLTPLSSAVKKCCKDSVSALLSFSGSLRCEPTIRNSSEKGDSTASKRNLPVSEIKLEVPTVDPRLGQPFSALVYAIRFGAWPRDMNVCLARITQELMCAGASLFESADHLLPGMALGNERGMLERRIIVRKLTDSAQSERDVGSSNLQGDGTTSEPKPNSMGFLSTLEEEDLLFLAIGMTPPASSRLFNLVRSECQSPTQLSVTPLPPLRPTRFGGSGESSLSPLCHALKCYAEQQRLEAYLQQLLRTKEVVGFVGSRSNDESLTLIADRSFFDFCLSFSTEEEGGEGAARDFSDLEPTSRKLCPPSFHYRKALALMADLLDEERKYVLKRETSGAPPPLPPPPQQIVSVMSRLINDLPLCCDNSLVQPVDAVVLSERECQRILNARGRKYERLLSKFAAGAPSFPHHSEFVESFMQRCEEEKEKERAACESPQSFTKHMLPSLTPYFVGGPVTTNSRYSRHDSFFPHRCLDVAISRVRLDVCELLLLVGASVNAIPPFLIAPDGNTDGARHLPTVIGENEGSQANAKAAVDKNNENREREVTRDFYRFYESTSVRNEDWDWDEGEPPLTHVGGGNTPLHMMCYCLTKYRTPDGMAAEILSALLDRGADPSALNDDGQTPLQVLGAASELSLPKTVLCLTSETGPQY